MDFAHFFPSPLPYRRTAADMIVARLGTEKEGGGFRFLGQFFGTAETPRAQSNTRHVLW